MRKTSRALYPSTSRQRETRILSSLRLKASRIARLTGRKVAIIAETSPNKGWSLVVTPGYARLGDIRYFDYDQSRYVSGPEAKKRRATAYWRRKTGRFYA